MRCLVVHESMWGNTEEVARAVAQGLGEAAECRPVGEAPRVVPDDVGLLVVGGPTHAFSMARPSTRRDALSQGALEHSVERGLREWLAEVTPGAGLDVAVFDTRVRSMRRLPGSAARAAARVVRRCSLGRLLATASFYVEGTPGPLVAGELERARAWGLQLRDAAQAGEGRTS